jgi:hypothetical protein
MHDNNILCVSSGLEAGKLAQRAPPVGARPMRTKSMLEIMTFDRVLGTVAILVGVGGILRAEWLFEKLYKREKTIRESILREANTVLLSYASFSRALQAIDLEPTEMSRDGAFAMLTSYHFQQLLHRESFTPEQLNELRTMTRDQVEKQARTYAEQFVTAGLGKLKDGMSFNDDLG